MLRPMALLIGALALTACTESTPKSAKTPYSTTTITSGDAPTSNDGTQKKPHNRAEEEHEDTGDSLRN